MSILAKLSTAFRGRIRESAEVVIDANSLRIFAQEIHECDQHLLQTKKQLANIIAEKMRIKREISVSKKHIEQLETRIAKELDESHEDIALQLAKTLAEKEAVQERQQQHYAKLERHEADMQQALKGMASKLELYRSEYRMAKATEKLQEVQTVNQKQYDHNVAHFSDMQSSLLRIQERQQNFADQVKAMEQVEAELNGEPMEYQQDNIAAQNVLQRIKDKQQSLGSNS